MSQPKTKNCAQCNETFEYERSTARYCPTCNTPAERQRRRRTRHARPHTLRRLVTSQKWDSLRRRGGDIRRQKSGGEQHASLGLTEDNDPVVIDSGGTRRQPGSRYAVSPTGRKTVRFDYREPPFPPVADEAIRLATNPKAKLESLYEQAAHEFVFGVIWPEVGGAAHYRPDRWPRLTEHILWYWRWRHHPELTESQREFLVRNVGPLFRRAKAHAVEDQALLRAQKLKETEDMELATIAAQNEEILARIGHLREVQAEILERVVETVERVRERFPNESEVGEAVERLLEDIGS